MKRWLSVMMTMVLGMGLLAVDIAGQDEGSYSVPSVSSVPLGEMDAFWRNQPVIGEWLAGGQGLVTVPAYLMDPGLSFAYQKRPYSQEVLFADHLNVVRLLGGWRPGQNNAEGITAGTVEEADLAYRDANGDMQYRWDRLQNRLDPYIDAGYTDLTIVLDNIPYMFPAVPDSSGPYGQIAPVEDLEEWAEFIEALAAKLVDLYGYAAVNNWRFRLGTENQGVNRFAGTQTEYFQMYDYTAEAIRSILPGAKFGPFNTANARGNMSGFNVDVHALAGHAVSGTNYATGQVGSPYDFSAISYYAIPRIENGNLVTRPIDPERRVMEDTAPFWNNLSGIDPSLAGVSREMHEFGILRNEYGMPSTEPGARGAAWTFHILFHMKEHAGLDRFWHWDVVERINIAPNRPQLLQSNGWLYSILEHTVGGDTHVLEVEDLDETSSMFKSIGVFGGDKQYILTSAFNVDPTQSDAGSVSVKIPKSAVAISSQDVLRSVYLADDNDVYRQIREDLDTEGLLTSAYQQAPHLLGNVNQMGGWDGWNYVNTNWSVYEQMVQDSLTLSGYTGTFQEHAGHYEFVFDMEAPMVMVIEISAAETGELKKASKEQKDKE